MQIGRRLISEGWTQGVNERELDGKQCFCSLGALRRAKHMSAAKNDYEAYEGARLALAAAIRQTGFKHELEEVEGLVASSYDVIVDANDAPDTTQEKALVWFDKAIVNQGRVNAFIKKGPRQ